jgi:hypothetical protein
MRDGTVMLPEDPETKRRLTFTDDGGDMMMRRETFLSIHVQLLQALYPTPSFDANVFSLVQDFLKERSRLAQAKKETLRLLGIYEQATKVSGTEGPPTTVDSTTNESSTRKRKSPSPRLGPSLSMQSPINASATTTKRPFTVIARLLQLRSNDCSKNFQKDTERYKALLESVRQEVQSLEEQLELMQSDLNKKTSIVLEKLLSTNQEQLSGSSPLFDMTGHQAEKSRLTEVKYKIQLWNLLVDNVKQIL